MKRFFIFAAMLLTMTAYAGTLNEDPPLIFPGDPEEVILVPQDLYDIDRSVALCEYVYYHNIGQISINCYGTGRRTALYIVDEYGNIYDRTTIDTDVCNNVTLNIPEEAGYYMLILDSEKYHGESTIRIR